MYSIFHNVYLVSEISPKTFLLII